MNYQQALDFILSRSDFERYPGYNYAGRFDLRRMHELLHDLGDPHTGPRSVHIAGTKGKGSTSAMIASGLRAAGHKTGLYTSPHLHTIRERINVDGKRISTLEFARAASELKPCSDAVDRRNNSGQLTTFELLTAAAFIHFRREEVDFQVLEVGLGGRLDATNMVTPDVCVITSISLDHTDVLGDTVAKIAAEKAGIIKPGCVVVCAPQVPEAAAVIRDVCQEQGARLISVGADVTWARTAADLWGQTLAVDTPARHHEVWIPLLGEHQLHNAASAVAALEYLGVSDAAVRNGLSRTKWPGRLQVLKRRPQLVVDGAHNPDSAKKLAQALRQYFQFERLILIIGLSADKSISGIVDELAPAADSVICTRSSHPRAASPETIAGEFARHQVRSSLTDNVPLAVNEALSVAGNKDLICATGSLFVVAEVIQHLRGLRPERYSG